MVSAFRRTSRYILIGLVAVLSACGGGGGGGGGGVSIGVSPSSLTFAAPDASSSTPPKQNVSLTVSGGSAWLGAITYNGSAVAGFNYLFSGVATAEIEVNPSPPGNLGAGTHTGSVMVQVCADQYCNSEVAGSPFAIQVTYVVGGLGGSPASISLNAAEGESPVVVSETISNSSGPVEWTSSVVYNGAATDWAALTPTSGSTLPATMSVGATPLPPGTYTATMQVTIPGKTLNVPITYTVAKALAPTPAAFDFNIDTTVTLADFSRSVSVGTNYPVGSPKTINWSAVTNVPWLSVTPLAGNSSSQPLLTATLDQAQVDQMPNGIYWGNITLSSPDAFVSNFTIPVSVFIDRSQINYVSPYVASANKSAEVIIRGRKFSQLSVQNIKFGSVSASSFHVVSDTEIRATHPSLAAGQYPVSIVTTGIIGGSATLTVTNPPQLTDLTFMDSSTIKGIIHDPERNAVLAFPLNGSFIERHTFNGTSWSSTSVTLPYSFGPGVMSPDGKEIVLLTQDHKVVRVDAVTLAVLSETGPKTETLKAAVALNDGNVLIGTELVGFNSLYQFDLPNQFYGFISNSTLVMPLLYINASGDGSHAILRYDNTGTAYGSSWYSYDAGTGQFAPLATPIAGFINNIDRTGAHILSNNTNVYNASLALLGNLPYFNDAANGCSTSAAVISQDGTRAYTFCGLSPNGRVYTYNLTAATVNGYFPAVGSYVAVSPLAINFIQLSADGKTLFLIDTAKTSMVSLP